MPTKVHLVKAMVFPVVIYGCESWPIKKAEHRRTDAFELVLEKTLESLLDCKVIQPVHPKRDQSWVFIEGLMLRLKPQHFGCLMWRVDSLEKTLMLGGIGVRKRREQQDEMVGCIFDLMDMSLSELWELVMDRRPGMLWFMGSQSVRHDWETGLNWIDFVIETICFGMNRDHSVVFETAPKNFLSDSCWIRGLFQFFQRDSCPQL